MTSRFVIDCEWTNPIGSPPEIAETSAFIEIKLGDDWVTRCENAFSGSVTNRPLLSAYPLALWLASSWWRLRWETGQQRTEPSSDWKLSHALAASGAGFVWPALTLESDGESIEMSLCASGPSEYEPLRYLGQFKAWVPAGEFEAAVSHFVMKVLSRLNDRGIARTPLQDLWDELSSERADHDSSEFRKFEAILGFDPGDAKDDYVHQLRALQSSVGDAAAQEIAYASSGSPTQLEVTAAMVETARTSAPEGRFQLLPADVGVDPAMAQQRHPWRRGYALASALRQHCGWGESVVADNKLSELLGISPSALQTSPRETGSLPFGLAVRPKGAGEKVQFVFRSHSHVRRRFDAARMLADSLLAPATDAWLPTTATHTARQKAQRAFAAELLCPIHELRAFVNGDTSDYRLEDAAWHFDVAVETVRHQLANRGRLP